MRRARAGLAAVLVALCAALVWHPLPAAAAPGPSSAPEYWFDTWRLTSLWRQGITGRGMVIAEIDTGVNAALPALRGRILPGTDLGRGGDGRIDREIDAFGHGTAMASIMVGRPAMFSITGMAPGARILPVAVPLNGTTDADQPDNLAQAITYAADHGARIISMSLGGKRTPRNDTLPCPADEQQAVFHAMREGAVVVASVGNTGPTDNTVEDPGACLGVVSVGSVDRRGVVAAFSARQPYLTLVAPGVNVPSLSRVAGRAFSGRGTSQSTAIVSAALALVWSRFPTASNRSIVARLLATLDDRRGTPSSAYGYGTVNPYAAITRTVPADAPNPVFAAAAPFLARDGAFDAAESRGAPAPAGRTGAPPGHYAVGTAPRLFVPQVLVGLGLGVGGLALLVVLTAVVLRRPRPARAGRTVSGGPVPRG